MPIDGETNAKLEPALYVVATPIGNLADISERALDVLKRVDVVAAEDTRNTQSLLMQYGVKARLIAVHDHNETHAADGVVKLITEGKSVALVTDAGTPAISDPGARVVAAVHAASLKVVPIPGASAVVAAVSASGEGEGGFLFHGFLPTKTGDRKRALAALYPLGYPIVLYESPHRIVESMTDIAAVFGASREVVICREITKKFETIKRVLLADAVAWLESDSNQQRGEFVLVLTKPNQDAAIEAKTAETATLERTLRILLAELPVKQAVAMAVQLTSEKKNTVYELALKIRDELSDV
ncbi:MAG: 16S rRNA (cytidine(1402)-2'-O)-methyltransferase [Betaproteobacteria bacterium]|jgi:16S rRNA (cytidine1402-2'-O)-methyltransferase